MASSYTKNYNLCQWEGTDKVLRTEFNADNAKIDGALSATAASMNGLQATLDSHAAAMARLGNCQLYFTGYTGDGTFGINHKTTFTFPHKPVLVVVTTEVNVMITLSGTNGAFVGISPNDVTTCLWSGNTLSWYSSNTAQRQMNELGKSYRLLALLDAEA